MLEIVELDLDGLFRPLGLPHVRDSLPAPVIPTRRRAGKTGKREITTSLRDCEERSDEAIQLSACGAMDCFAALAMTARAVEAPYFITPFSL
jgi:hypothetical protein